MSTARPVFSLLSVLANNQRHALSSADPWLLLMDIEWPGTPVVGVTTQHLRFARNTEPVTFDANDGFGPQTYEASNFEMGELQTGSDGSVPSVTVTASNVMRVLQTVIEQYAGLAGANLYLYVLNTANPQGEPDLALQFTILQAVCTAKDVQIKCGAPSPMRRLFPIFKYWPNTCMWQYKSGVGCPYSGALPACDKTLDGANGCIAHFPGQTIPALLFPGIDTNAISAAGVA